MANERPANEDLVTLLPIGYDALYRALKDGVQKYGPGHWRTVSLEDHMQHIEAHITAWQCGDRNEDHIAHIICRAIAMYALIKEGEKHANNTTMADRDIS